MHRILAATAAVFLFSAAEALAQQEFYGTTHAVSPEREVLVVRGERRQRLSTPTAGQILGPATLAERGVATLDDAAIAAPGLHMINDQDPGTNIVSLRGVATDRLQQAAIAYVRDGVALADTELFTAPLFDVAAVSVLRGPQGALLGKNAAGGAIEILSRNAGDPGGYLEAGLGNGQSRTLEGAGSFSLAPGWAMRAAGVWRAADGWIENQTLNRTVDAQESRAARLSALGGIGRVELDLSGLWVEEDGGAAWASSGDVTGDFGGALDGAALTDPIGDFEGRSYRRWLQGAARARYGFRGGEITGLIAYDDYRKRWVEELDYRPGPLTFFGAPLFPDGLQPISQPTDIEALTAEVRLRRELAGVFGAEGEWIIGAFVQDIQRDRIDDFGPLLFGAPAPAFRTDSTQAAVFAGLTLRWLERAELDVQLRFDQDERSQLVRSTADGALLSDRAATFERLQPRVGLSYRLWGRGDGQVWAYGAYGEGFRTGGFNPPPTPAALWTLEFAPEITRTGEIGLKSWFATPRGGALALEITAFRSEIDQFQNYTFLEGNSVTLTVPSVSVEGVEITGDWAFSGPAGSSLFLAGGYALADARVNRFIAPDPLIPGATRDYTGNRTPNAPEWTGTLSVGVREYQLPGAFALSVRLDLNATGETFFEIDNALRAPPKTWADARVGLSRGPWSLSLWGRNLTDERWAISAFGQGMLPLLAGLGPDGPFDTFTINRGRQWGANLRREF